MSTILDLNNMSDIDEDESKFIYGYCSRTHRKDKIYHIFHKDIKNNSLCELSTIFNIKPYYKPSNNSICKNCIRKYKTIK